MSSSSVRTLAIIFLALLFFPVLSIIITTMGAVFGGIFSGITSVFGAIFGGLFAAFTGIFGSKLVWLIMIIAAIVYVARKN